MTFFSASLRSRCGPLVAADTGLFVDAPPAADVLVSGVLAAVGVPGSCGPPAQPDSANPAANAVTTLNLLAGKGFLFLA